MSDTSNDKSTIEPDPIPVFPESAPSTKPKYMVVGDHFYAQTDAGEVKIPLRYKTALIRLMPDDVAMDQVEQIFWLNPEDKKLQRQLDELYIDDSRELAREWVRAEFERQKARLGESGRSSRS